DPDGATSILAVGEVVVNAQVARAHAYELEAMNPGHRSIVSSHHMAAGGWVGDAPNDNSAVVSALQASSTLNMIERRMQTNALLDELRALRAEVSRLRADINGRSGKPGR